MYESCDPSLVCVDHTPYLADDPGTCELAVCFDDYGYGYAEGQEYSPDGCNTCTCDASGAWACTEKACL